MLSEEQQAVVDATKNGEHVCMLSSSGTGKSFTIDQIKTGNTVVVAPTAVAAENVKGVTAHSAFSLGLGLQTEEDMARQSENMVMLFSKNSPTDMLIFDEGFNIRADIFDAIDEKLCKLRNSTLPFGGIQVVIAGDPLQNEPIVGYEEKAIFNRQYLTPFIFSSRAWKRLKPKVHVFTKIFRNENEEQQIMLNHIRSKEEIIVNGKPAWQFAVDYINSVAKHGVDSNAEIHLTVYRADAEKQNKENYNAILSEEYNYKAEKSGKYKVPKEMKVLSLKIGTRVMFTVNNREQGYLNGTTGRVIGLYSDAIVVEKDDGDIVDVEKYTSEEYNYTVLNNKLKKTAVGTMKQFPLMLAYAATISKVQGATLNSAVLDLGESAFACGMLYVGLSRLVDLRNLTLTRPIEYDDVKVDRRAVNFIKKHSK